MIWNKVYHGALWFFVVTGSYGAGATTSTSFYHITKLWNKAHVADTAAPTIGTLKKQTVVLKAQNGVLKRELGDTAPTKTEKSVVSPDDVEHHLPR